MARGRIPTPKILNDLKGDPSKRRRNTKEPEAPLGMPDIPDYLDDVARDEWFDVCKQLSAMSLLSKTDRTALEMYCVAYSRYRTAQANVAKFGPVILSPNKNYPMKSPWASELDTQFGLLIWPIEDCFNANQKYISDLADDIDMIDECCLVFAGNVNSCANSIRFERIDWQKIKTWIEDGGRFFLATEYQGCLSDSGQLAIFLDTLGSTIVWEGGQIDSNCGGGNRIMTPGGAKISQDIVTAQMALTAELSGGDAVVFQAPSGPDMVMVEQLGDGFLFVSGDSNHWSGCGYDNCKFALALLETPDGDII